MNHISGADRANTTDHDARSGSLLALTIEALSHVAGDKVENVARQWLSTVQWHVTEGHRAIARSLAVELALVTPSMMGTTAFDRLARAMKGRPASDIAAISLLRRSLPRFARLSGRRFEDLATGEARMLLPSPPSKAVGDGVVFGRFAETGDGCVIATGTLVLLDEDAQSVARGFVRPGRRGLGHPVRCAEAVYRHLVRGGLSDGSWREPEPEPDLPFDPIGNPLDALAAAWASLDREPGPEELAKAREFTVLGRLMDALVCVSIAQVGGARKLAEAYRKIAAVLVETMAARAAYGSGHMSLDRIAAAIDAAIVRGDHPPETKVLFNTLRERARMASGRAAGVNVDLDRLVQRIQALRAKTVAQGCTEAEALAAAEKVAELLDRHGLSVSELDLRKQTCEGIGVETGRKRRGPMDDCMGMIATFFDCRVWGETGADGTLRYIFFGLPGDVQAAVYLHDLIALAFASETAAYQTGAFYGSTHTSQRRSVTNSFQLGLARGINAKLDTLRQARAEAAGATNGRALVPVKQSILDQEMERLGLTFHRVNAARRKVIPGAFSAGKEAGERFDYRPGIEGKQGFGEAAL